MGCRQDTETNSFLALLEVDHDSDVYEEISGMKCQE